MNHKLMVATVRRFLETQQVDTSVEVAVLAAIWKMDLLLVSTWPVRRIALTNAGEEYLATFGDDA